MKWINTGLWIAGALLLLFVGCTAARPENGRRLNIWSGDKVIITEDTGEAPRIIIEGLQFLVIWENVKGEMRVFIGPRRDISISIEGGKVEELQDEKKEEKRPPIKPKKFKFLKWGKI